MTEIKLTKRYPQSRTEDIVDAYMRGWNDALDAVQNGKFIINDDRKTESNSEKPNNCEDKPQTCYTCEYEWRDGTDEPCVYCYGGSKYKSKDEPQKHCHRPSNMACHPEQGNMWCRGCDYWYADEPQTEREGE